MGFMMTEVFFYASSMVGWPAQTSIAPCLHKNDQGANEMVVAPTICGRAPCAFPVAAAMTPHILRYRSSDLNRLFMDLLFCNVNAEMQGKASSALESADACLRAGRKHVHHASQHFTQQGKAHDFAV
eukprot:1146285-Pelagomonas_calceolata.AAC.4